ncbi:VWA domain-containing protein [Halodesulfovibrio sp.]|uniref:cobaltochelatase CobT-related protein n=1 Tax=Halodesulfovibrio sp. TaxID=1912772 RepID=UPI0025BAFE97|nr:VWA domain-containing protein [Halodesulfovibrio sp.]
MDRTILVKSLPLLASMLGRKYGVTVQVGGDEAFTNGRCIQLPGLPAEGDSNLVNIVRSYLDHETAHIRFTDFACLNDSVTPLEKHVWNIFEDWRVENCFVKLYPGARNNFQWLIRHIFVSPKQELPTTPEGLVLNWLLLTVRSWEVAELKARVNVHATAIDQVYPQLRFQLEGLLGIMKSNCPDSKAAMTYAKKAVACIQQQCSRMDTTQQDGMPDGISFSFGEAKQRLEGLCGGSLEVDALPVGLGEAARTLLSAVSKEGSVKESVTVAVVGNKVTRQIDEGVLRDVNRVTTGMQAKFNSLMQTELLTRTRPSKQGRIDWSALYKLAVSKQDIFYQRSESRGVDTAFHILLDSSGSMGSRIKLATTACYSVAKALALNGINVGITAFPALADDKSTSAVLPLVLHGEKVHSNIQVQARGTTPMTESLWWVLQQMSELREQRKILLIVSDGEPDDVSGTLEVIKKGRKYGVEFYGLGICAPEIKGILPQQSSVVATLDELPSAMFAMLREAVAKSAA